MVARGSMRSFWDNREHSTPYVTISDGESLDLPTIMERWELVKAHNVCTESPNQEPACAHSVLAFHRGRGHHNNCEKNHQGHNHSEQIEVRLGTAILFVGPDH